MSGVQDLIGRLDGVLPASLPSDEWSEHERLIGEAVDALRRLTADGEAEARRRRRLIEIERLLGNARDAASADSDSPLAARAAFTYLLDTVELIVAQVRWE